MRYDDIIGMTSVESAAEPATRISPSIYVRCRFVRDWFAAKPVSQHKSLLLYLFDNKQQMSWLSATVLEGIARQTDRARILRIFLCQLPLEIANLSLPDGTRAAITGHVIDRLMTRFNAPSVIDALGLLHRRAGRLRVAQLPALVQVSQQIHRVSNATHWQFADEIALIETGGAIVTAYCPHSSTRRSTQKCVSAGRPSPDC